MVFYHQYVIDTINDRVMGILVEKKCIYICITYLLNIYYIYLLHVYYIYLLHILISCDINNIEILKIFVNFYTEKISIYTEK